ncbi:cation diffusion facilitator family transporter [Pontibacter rugosus]|uniref:Cation diffusion facilitator family transporter n=1 Tax=Pontibacter rugosus TaxID=1745966 RepID=A0ABW3SSN7_9BACT
MGHDYSHAHGASKNIAFAFFLNIGFTIFEIIGGFYVNSVAIISDALHDLGDSLSLGVSWYLQKKSDKNADEKFTFGYKRFSLLGALINSIVLVLGAGFCLCHLPRCAADHRAEVHGCERNAHLRHHWRGGERCGSAAAQETRVNE